jgi:hypothetical protein
MLCIGGRFTSKPFQEFQPFTWSIISNLVVKPISRMEGLKFPKWSNNTPITFRKNWKDFLFSFFHFFFAFIYFHVCFWHLLCVAYDLYELSSFLWNLFLIVIIDLYVFLFAYSYTNTITIILACVSLGFCLVM